MIRVLILGGTGDAIEITNKINQIPEIQRSHRGRVEPRIRLCPLTCALAVLGVYLG